MINLVRTYAHMALRPNNIWVKMVAAGILVRRRVSFAADADLADEDVALDPLTVGKAGVTTILLFCFNVFLSLMDALPAAASVHDAPSLIAAFDSVEEDASTKSH